MKDADIQLQNEWKLVRDARESEAGEQKLARYIKGLVQDVSNAYLSEYKKKRADTISEEIEYRVRIAAWAYFSFAVKKYAEKIELMESGEIEPYSFSEYFTWFIRQGVHRYIQEEVEEGK